MHATNALRANPQEDDEDVKSDVSDAGDEKNQAAGQQKKKKKQQSGRKNGSDDTNKPKESSGYPTPYVPYQDALYYNGPVALNTPSPPPRKSNGYRYQEAHERAFNPDERIVEERWRRRRRWTNAADDEEPAMDEVVWSPAAAREDPYDPDSNMRYDTYDTKGRGRVAYDPYEDELRRRRFEEYSNGGRRDREGRRRRGGRGGDDEQRPGRQQREEDNPLQAFVPVPLPGGGGWSKEDKRNRRGQEDDSYDDRGGGARRRKSRRGRGDEDQDEEEEMYQQSCGRGQQSEDGRRSTRSRRPRRRSSRSRSESRRRHVGLPKDDPYKPEEKYTIAKAAKAAAWIGLVEAWRCRKEEGPWTGQKARRILLASSVGVVIGALRNGRLLDAGKKPYADSAMTGFYGIDFLKRVAKHTEHEKGALKEQRLWREEAEGRAPHQLAGKERSRR